MFSEMMTVKVLYGDEYSHLKSTVSKFQPFPRTVLPFVLTSVLDFNSVHFSPGSLLLLNTADVFVPACCNTAQTTCKREHDVVISKFAWQIDRISSLSGT